MTQEKLRVFLNLLAYQLARNMIGPNATAAQAVARYNITHALGLAELGIWKTQI
ncbi:hypothetical protein [Mycoavidus sp. B2-EB]|uniref:hypothetical protein n=1 Tax=Mycoavidus sp. B2-EB TaxID=2651972 RepID=UPI0016273FE2|nr:hypothetical protein [Mycoavidus sp. B2-EB]BBO60183.1 hypothetical protein MPB2EB_1322 [Mycoavidus sp. B2-EB]